MTMTAYGDPDRTILPGPNPTPATITTALRVLEAAAENVLRIDVDALRALIVSTNVQVTDTTWRTMQAAARFRIALTAAPANTLPPQPPPPAPVPVPPFPPPPDPAEPLTPPAALASSDRRRGTVRALPNR